MPGIFISYRREDSIAYAGRLYDRLTAHFGKERIFMDIDTIEPGVDFVEILEQTVASCDVLIAVIGKQWLSAADEEGGRRIDNVEDFVRLEIAAALDRKIRIIPALVGGARMPRSQDLPDALSKLARRNALEISDTSFHQSVTRLIEASEKAIAQTAKQESEAAGKADRHDKEDGESKPKGAESGRSDMEVRLVANLEPEQVETKPRKAPREANPYLLALVVFIIAVILVAIAHQNIK